MRQKITHALIAALTPPAKGQAFLWDSELLGFGVRITRAGVKSFVLQKRIHGKDRRMTLGRCGVMTVRQARRDALVKFRLIASGGDPVTRTRL
ncbi:MAG: Arm DNA-binding domain-containing protein [Acidiferrobacteraceae bacterium]